MGLILIVIAASLNACASILLKFGVIHGIDLTFKNGIVSFILQHGYILAGLFLFAMNVFVYVAALRVMPLSSAYPIMTALSFIIAGTASFFLLAENITVLKVVGYAVILIGILMVLGPRVG